MLCTVCVLTGSVGSKQKHTSDHLGLWQVLIRDDLDCLLFQVTAGAPLKKEYTEEVRETIMKCREGFGVQNNVSYGESELLIPLAWW